MLQQPYDVERMQLVSRQQETQREILQIRQARLAISLLQRMTLLQQLLTALGWRLVEIGSGLVSRNSLKCKDVELNKRIAGLA